MSWIAFLSDKQRELMTKNLLKAHVSYLKEITNTGELKLCGPLLDGTAIMIFNVDTEQHARSLVASDPFSKASYYKTVRFAEFMEANMENEFLLTDALTQMDSSEYKASLHTESANS
ncbi:hypothetical protein MACH09_11140 [Vibrio sp. MACH09]|uniref:YciI family protein n=1 Tax=Vibrio sp. MACH09 TaxID=3025122 RepID=UPI0027912EC7|nr:YciI family protein [Vibrio sp. MACH09]GLO60606.1 hypothetical protein MACH09_11140 [Vibrio sp. MACH09]